MKNGLVDVNVNLFQWPFRRLVNDSTARLVAKLKSHGVEQAWAGSFEGVVQHDIAGVNARLAEECRAHGHGILLPFGSINPVLPGWEENVRRCHEVHHMRGIRLHPNYHGYKLEEPVFARLLQVAAERKLIVQMAASMEDVRTQPALGRVPNVDLAPLPDLIKKTPGARVVLINCLQGIRPDLLLKLVAAERVSFDMATLEGAAGIETLLKQVPADRILFGSNHPFFYFESAWLKLKESALTEKQAEAIRGGNAERVIGLKSGA